MLNSPGCLDDAQKHGGMMALIAAAAVDRRLHYCDIYAPSVD
jgi:hypothetical protein